MEPIEVECPNCGASLPAGDPRAGYRCTYCGTAFELRRARGAKTLAGVRLSPEQLEQLARSIGREVAASQGPQAPPVDATALARRHRRAYRRWTVLTGLLTFGLIAYSRWAHQSARTTSQLGTGPASTPNTAAFLWDDSTGLPEIVRTEDRTLIVGRTRAVPGTDALSIEAFEASTGERVYRIGDLGTYAGASKFVRFAVAGGDLVVSTAEPALQIHDAATGALRQKISLTDRVEDFCRSGDERHVFVVQVDGKALDHPVGSTELQPIRRLPKECRNRSNSELVDPFEKGKLRKRPADSGKLRGAFVRRGTLRGKPSIPGTDTLARYGDGEGRIVVVGVQSAGTAVPKAAAFAGKDAKEPLWMTDVADVPLASLRDADLLAAVSGNRLYAVFGVGTEGWRMTALDTGSGARIWSQDLRPLFSVDRMNFLLPVDDVLLIGRGNGIEVRRAADGELLYILGTLDYDRRS